VNQILPDSNKWFVCPKLNPKAEMRLFLFPYAGGSPAVFWKWAAEFPDFIETWIAYYPGRGSRFSEPPIKRIDVLVKNLSQAIHPYLEKPFAFFGHSLGGLVAFELASHLHQNHLLQPNTLLISGCRAPHLPAPYSFIHSLPDAEFLKALQDFNGTPDEILNHPELMELLLPTLRTDFEIFEGYQFNSSRHSLGCPVVVFGGLEDRQLSQEHLQGWAIHTTADFKIKYFPGDHFFINTAKKAVIDSIIDELTATYANDR